MAYECNNCGLEYDTAAELANHKRRFCRGGNYGDPQKLERRVKALEGADQQVDHTLGASRRSAAPSSGMAPYLPPQTDGADRAPMIPLTPGYSARPPKATLAATPGALALSTKLPRRNNAAQQAAYGMDLPRQSVVPGGDAALLAKLGALEGQLKKEPAKLPVTQVAQSQPGPQLLPVPYPIPTAAPH